MSPQHLDRLSAIDAAFLTQETPTTHMHIGELARLEGRPLELGAFLDYVASQLHLVPRYRQKLAVAPLETGRPVWIDDPTFNLSYHVRHTALPAPGDHAALLALCGRIFSQPLDRSKPLWELWLVEGSGGSGGSALISKTHHALVDGTTGVDLLTVLFDRSARRRRAKAPEPWVPQPEPGSAALAARGLQGAARTAAERATGVLGVVTRPEAVLGKARDIARGAGAAAWTALSSSPDTPIDVAPGPHRRMATVTAELEAFKAIKNAFGATVNDVVLAVVAGALAQLMHARGRRTDGVELRACIPVSVQAPDAGSELTQVLVPLPVSIPDPVARLQHIRNAIDDVKQSHRALGASAIVALEGFAAPTLHAQASRLDFAGRPFSLLVTNVPGPQVPLYVLGRRLEAIFPISFLAGERALAVAVMSYDGKMHFGLLGDFDALPDLGVVADGIEVSLAELLRAAT